MLAPSAVSASTPLPRRATQPAGRRLADAVRSIGEGAELLAEARRPRGGR